MQLKWKIMMARNFWFLFFHQMTTTEPKQNEGLNRGTSCNHTGRTWGVQGNCYCFSLWQGKTSNYCRVSLLLSQDFSAGPLLFPVAHCSALLKSNFVIYWGYSKTLRYMTSSCTDLDNARFWIGRVQKNLRHTNLCSENLKLHGFLMILPLPW